MARAARRIGRCGAGIIAGMLAVLPAGVGAANAPADASKPAVTVAPATLRDITPSASYVGRVQAVNTVNLIARVTGFLEKQDFKEGQFVKTGDLLFLIEQDPYQAAVAQAEANLAKAQATQTNAELQLRRAQELVRSNTVAQATVDQDVATERSAAADVMAAKAALQQAQINLGYTEIKAPIDGRIGMVLINVGNFVSPTSGTLATIVSQNPMYVLFPVPTQQVIRYKQQLTEHPEDAGHLVVHIKLATGQDYPESGNVDFLDIQANQSTDTVIVRAQFPNPKNLLVSGQIADVTVEAGTPTKALTIPEAALQLDQSGPYVLVVGTDDKVAQQRVKLGAVQGADIVVQQGLKEGDRVIVEGIQKVRPGEVVAPSQAAAANP
jgi:membrane fusion protein (multidrug efflux system)